MKFLNASLPVAGAIFCVLAAAPAQAGLIINPTFASNIVSDPNVLAIEGSINSAIATYEATFADPITVNITFQEGAGLGGSSFFLYTFDYTSFYNALVADGKTADDAAALAHLATDGNPITTAGLNPVSGTDTVLMKAATAHALGLSCSIEGCGDSEGGTITLNTSLTNPGSPGSPGTYNLLPVIEHEIDEILGLGSTLGLGLPSPYNNDPSPEDFFRFAAGSGGARSFTSNSSAKAYFSIDDVTDLAQYDNQNDGGDFGDWQSNPRAAGVNPQVQDAFATPGANPALNAELRALDVIGYDRNIPATPEPASFFLMGGALLAGVFSRRRVRNEE